MNKKWLFISLFFLLFIAFGSFQEQLTIANQEIILEFVDEKIDDEIVKITIADVEKKLNTIGATNIKFSKTKNGTLKISYYSEIAIEEIESALSNQNRLVKNNNKENGENNSSSDYSLDIYELTNQADSSNLAHKNLLEIKFNFDRFISNDNIPSNIHASLNKTNYLFYTTYKAYRNITFTKKEISYTEPEVRAGPKKELS